MGKLQNKAFFFVLTAESLSWYKDEEEREQKYQLLLDGLRIMDTEDKSFVKRKNTFSIFNPDRRTVYKDHASLDLTCATQEEVENWQASFLRAGVYPIHTEEDEPEEQVSSVDPSLERQIEKIRNLVDS